MKKFGLFAAMAAIFIISASVAIGQGLYTPWVVESMNSTAPAGGSFNTGIYLLNTSGSSQATTLTLYKKGATSTTTTISTTIAGHDVNNFIFSNYTQTPTHWAGNADVKIATLEVDNSSGNIVGIVTRFKSNLSVIYAEKLWSWTAGSGSF